MRNNIQAAQAARFNKHLNSTINYNGQIMSMDVYLHKLHAEGRKGQIKEVPKYFYDRVKYNRMGSHAEQEAYKEKLKEMKTDYRAVHPDGYFTSLTKSEYEYFCSLSEDELIPTGGEYCTEEELKHLFKLDKVNL